MTDTRPPSMDDVIARHLSLRQAPAPAPQPEAAHCACEVGTEEDCDHPPLGPAERRLVFVIWFASMVALCLSVWLPFS